MALLKTWCLLPLAALLILCVVPTVAEVVKSMSDCAEFLLQQTPPHIPDILERGNILNQNRYKPICQTWKNARCFLTLYDTKNKIPVFSAYKYRGDNSSRPPSRWKIEPQLENILDNKNMMAAKKSKIYNYQAGDTDYTNTGFDRGHLFPSSYAFTIDDKKSTFTLTNIVPQEGTFNQGSWSRMESCIKCVLDKYCINNNGIVEGFLVTGAEPSTNNILNNKINIPSRLWSAFCCYSRSEMKWLASAHWAENIPEDKNKKINMSTRTLAELHDELGTEVFPGTECPLHTTVTQFYPQLHKVCQCPTPISTTSAPPTTTPTPPISTSAPPTTTSTPPISTSSPLTTISLPLLTTSAPLSTTSTPLTTTSVTSTSGPPSTTSGTFHLQPQSPQQPRKLLLCGRLFWKSRKFGLNFPSCY